MKHPFVLVLFLLVGTSKPAQAQSYYEVLEPAKGPFDSMTKEGIYCMRYIISSPHN
jgi:hypothetical protein